MGKSWDLDQLILRPEWLPMHSMECRAVAREGPEYRFVSSAYIPIFSSKFPIFKPQILLSDLIEMSSGSTASVYSKGERGQPC